MSANPSRRRAPRAPAEPCVALVHWLDAMMVGHWQEGTPDPREDLAVYSAGFLLHEDDERIVLVQSLTDGSYGNELQIPRGMVRSITRVPLGD